MGRRGRKSAAELAAVVAALPARPEPPPDLTDEQAKEWREIVRSMPGDWFGRETWALLAQFCRHVVAGRHVARLIDAVDDADLSKLARLLRMQATQSGAIASLSVKLRLAQSATSDRRKARGPAGKTPWE